MPINWGNVANAASAIGTVAQAAATTYTTINSANSSGSSNPAVQQYLAPTGGAGSNPSQPKDNTVLYVAIGGIGLLVVGGIVAFAVSKKKSS